MAVLQISLTLHTLMTNSLKIDLRQKLNKEMRIHVYIKMGKQFCPFPVIYVAKSLLILLISRDITVTFAIRNSHKNIFCNID